MKHIDFDMREYNKTKGLEKRFTRLDASRRPEARRYIGYAVLGDGAGGKYAEKHIILFGEYCHFL